jgi:cephalosporin-C deacetylase
MSIFQHSYSFDPTYGYGLTELLAVGAPEEPKDFEEFWRKRYDAAMVLDPAPELTRKTSEKDGWLVYDFSCRSTDQVKMGGWCLLPAKGVVERVMVILHGYGGREEPDFHWGWENTALLFPCARGMGRSPHASISANPMWHVLHDIQDRERYVHGGCVDDVWLAVSAALRLFPQAAGRVGLIGASFGGGIGSMALAWDERIARGHFSVPSFGNQPLRLSLKTTGSGAAVRLAHRRNKELVEKTLSYYDAATAARRIRVPVHYGCALFDPMVAPPGQFAIHNAVPGEKNLFVMKAGHFDFPEKEKMEQAMLQEVHHFFMSVPEQN